MAGVLLGYRTLRACRDMSQMAVLLPSQPKQAQAREMTMSFSFKFDYSVKIK